MVARVYVLLGLITAQNSMAHTRDGVELDERCICVARTTLAQACTAHFSG
jgi:hypothetical protein